MCAWIAASEASRPASPSRGTRDDSAASCLAIYSGRAAAVGNPAAVRPCEREHAIVSDADAIRARNRLRFFETRRQKPLRR